ncbi:hypothetical protein M0Q97_11650 [Candidatus Dojkabacteria bacterium]|jgi:hypothetical protein|nr:hypothetical protein [Candidatus Dojkabacteria bacterium]
MNKIEEIFKSWRISYSPDDEQAELATKRIEICDTCEFKTITEIPGIDILTRCSVCGCSLRAKIYTPRTYLDSGGSCPKEKWKNVEIEHLNKSDLEY